MQRSTLTLFFASLVLPALVLVPWALFGDAVPRTLMATFGPRALARFVLVVGGGSLALLSFSVYRMIGEARRSADPRRAFKRLGLGALVLVGVGLVTTGAVFGYYAAEHTAGSDLCRPAVRASTIAERRTALGAAEPHRRRVAFFNESIYSCEDLERDLTELDRGSCPDSVPSDARCRCGSQRFPEDWTEPVAPRCDHYDDQGDFTEEKRLGRPRSY